MAERRHSGDDSAGHQSPRPAGLELRVEVHWCAQCRDERTVQIMQLATDPEPIAMCTECGAGVVLWLSAELVDPPARPSSGQQGAA